jgi:hypothetical protein
MEHPSCFMHVPKSGGTSVHESLTHALPQGALSPKRLDASCFCAGFADFDLLGDWLRDQLIRSADDIASMRRSRIVSGHFCLETLTSLAPPSSIATVLREPRARLLSFYAYLRRHTHDLRQLWYPYTEFEAAQRPLDDFMREQRLAQETDNPVSRKLLGGERQIPCADFIASDDVPEIASQAVDRLESLGLVCVLELGNDMWPRLSQFFEVELEPLRSNVTREFGGLSDAAPVRLAITPATLELLEQRTAADAIVYEHALRRLTGASAAGIRRIRDAALADQLVRFGNDVGESAVAAYELASRIERLEQDGVRRGQELERLRSQLEAVTRSKSWRMTWPLREARRAVRRRVKPLRS